MSAAAREASAFEGQDPTLDRLLGDALANVLMRPSAGIELLEKNPARDNKDWVTAIGSAAMRTGELAVLTTILESAGAPALETTPDLLAWTASHALSDPGIDLDTLRERDADCDLFDAHPTRGRRTVDQPAPANFGELLYQLGADRVVLGRAPASTDPAPDSGRGLQPCRTGRLFVGHDWPEPLPRHLTLSMSVDGHRLHLSVRPEAQAPWVFASTRNVEAGEVVAEARRVSEGGAPDADFLRQRLAGELPRVEPPLAE